MGAVRVLQRHTTESRDLGLRNVFAGPADGVHRQVAAAPRRGAHGSDRGSDRVASAAAEGRLEDLVVVGGQSAGLIGGLLPAADIVQMLLSEAEAAIADAGRLLS